MHKNAEIEIDYFIPLKKCSMKSRRYSLLMSQDFEIQAYSVVTSADVTFPWFEDYVRPLAELAEFESQIFSHHDIL